MAQTAIPDGGLPTNAPVVTKEWMVGVGENETREWSGKKSDIDDLWDEKKAEAEAGNNIAQLTYKNQKGHATLIMRLGRAGNSVAGYPEDVSLVEELYAVDVSKDIACAPYYVGGAGDLDDDEVAFVRNVCERRLTEDEITQYAFDVGKDTLGKWANWNNAMKSLRYHLLRGVDTFFETGFILRKTEYGVRTSVIKASFTGINRVATTDPDFESNMDDLIESLPAGEWLYRPPQAEHLGRGKWRITREWHWAEKWSIVYNGTWNGP